MKLNRLAAALLAALMSSAAMSSAVMAGNDGVPTTPTLQTAAYVSGNGMGGLQTVPLFRNAYLSDSGIMTGVQLYSQSGATTPITFYVFDTQPTATPCTDKSAFSLGAADIAKLALQPFTLTPAATTGTTVSSAQLVQTMSIGNQDSTKARVVYVCLVAGGSVTPASTTDLTFKMSVAPD